MEELWSQEGGQVAKELVTHTTPSPSMRDSQVRHAKTSTSALAVASIPTSSAETKQNRRDPFQPFYSNRNQSDTTRKKTLQEYDLSELRLTAVIHDTLGNSSASLESPHGEIFIIKIGSLVGAKGGRVEAITDSKVVIAEPGDISHEGSSVNRRELTMTKHVDVKNANR